MYNRYIPQPDGSFRRRRIDDPQPRPIPPKQESRPPQKREDCPPPKQEDCPPPPPNDCPPECPPHREPRRDDSIPGFMRQLLPRGFDTGDLIVVLLLLLLAGDCEEDRSTALLTLALYLFM